ncbi:universal stress protein [Actibacterium ureilyticum]|uniref:universal stress protein n=1 Tax=Actibacterium ureilyticum TaxID=1590614 RepID=UPI000BAAB691|nr:universal stress protein [Actibacterium ureilyticum]
MYKHVLVPIAMDHSPQTGEALELARRLLAQGGRITALTVLEAIPPYVAQYLPEGQEQHNRQTIKTQLQSELGDAPDTHADVVVGHAGRTIVEYADEHDVDCIVIASHRPGLQDYFLGSTAARVVRHAPCAVLVVR